ncbi:MAG: hypothetical protein ACE5F9_09270 [Phycisphaerae bacterium]
MIMRPHRLVLLLISVVVVGGSLGLSAGYGLYHRSDAYRHRVEADLSEFFEMPCDVGRIRPRSFSGRDFENVTLWLPDRRDRVFFCERATWREVERAGGPTNELDLLSGVLTLGTDRWQTTDYYKVFASGLGHDFEDLDLSRVGLSDFEVSFARRNLSIHCRQTGGTIDMSDPAEGVAHLVAYELNGYRVRQGVQIVARFSPRNGVEVSELFLELPEVPLARIGLSPTLGSGISCGRFAGGIEYCSASPVDEVILRGTLTDVDLSEFSDRLPFGPVRGQLSVTVDEARMAGSVVTHLRGRGEITGLSLDSFAPLLRRDFLAGEADLNIQWVDLALGHVNRLVLDGRVDGLALEAILNPLGRGAAAGTLAIEVHSLRVVDDAIESADIEITAVPPAGRAGTIDRTLLLNAAQTAAHFSWPDWLPSSLVPDEIEYSRFGVRLLVRDNKMRILGTHGADGKTILTIRLAGRSFGVVKEQSSQIDLTPWIDRLLARARSYDPDGVRRWWKSRSGDHPSRRQPSGDPGA